MLKLGDPQSSGNVQIYDSGEAVYKYTVLKHPSEPQCVLNIFVLCVNRSMKTKTSDLCGRLQHSSGLNGDSGKHSK